MDSISETAHLISETISDYVELFHSRKDVEAAIKEDMSVMGYPYEIKWVRMKDSNDSNDSPLYKLIFECRINGAYVFLEFYYWD